jgi:hypothetical protein
VRINFSPFRFVLCALCALSVWSAPAFSQHSGSTTDEHAKATEHHIGVIHDWTDNHVLYPRFGPVDRLIKLQKDPRAIQHWQESYRKDYERWRGRHRHEHGKQSTMHRDWNINVNGVVGGPAAGTTVNNAAYPAKWTFSFNETLTGGPNTGSCLTDYLVVPVNSIPGATATGFGQPNIVGLYNLYSGGATSFCDRGTLVGSDIGNSATALFSYAVIADDGVVTTSPVTSMDGTLIAFVETGTTTGIAQFHVLAWKQGDGVVSTVATTGDGDQDVFTHLSSPIFTFTDPANPVAGSGTASDLPLPGGTDSISSPYVEYSDDVAYVGNDAGMIFKIKNVFCPSWAPCGGNSPSLDTSFGTGGVVTIGGTCTGAEGMVSSVTVDGVSGNIFAGCADGKLYAFTTTGAPVGVPLAVGDGTAIGGIVDPPVLDVVNGLVYTQSVNVGVPTVVQANISTNAATGPAATLAGPMTFSMHAPSFNDAYFTDPTFTDSLLYVYTSDSAGTVAAGGPEIVLWGIGFTASPGPVMNSGTPPVGPYPGTATNAIPFPIGQFEISPLTHFLTTGGEDRLFAGALGAFTGNVVSFDLNDVVDNPGPPPTGQVPGFPIVTQIESSVLGSEGTGTSGIVIDNDSSGVSQANSIYFGVAGAGTNTLSVVKLTQGTLQ